MLDVIRTVLPHSSFSNECCHGYLDGIIEGNRARIECNECRAKVAAMPADELQRMLEEMELVLDLAGAQCPHCGEMNLFVGLSAAISYVCSECGRVVSSFG